MKTSLTKRTLEGGMWRTMSVLIQAVLQVVVLAVLARHVLPQEFGLIAIAGVATSFAMLFSEIGLGPAVVQRQELNDKHLRVAFSASVLLSVLLMLGLWLLAPMIEAFFRTAGVAIVLRVASFSFLFSSFGIVADSLLLREMRFKRLMLADIIGYFLGYALVAIPFAVSGFGEWSLVAGMLAYSLARSILVFLMRPHSILPGFSRRELRELLNYGGGLTLSRLFNYIALKGDYFVIGRTLGSTALGQYERAFRIMFLPARYMGSVLSQVLFPAMAQVQNSPVRVDAVYFRGIGIVNLCLLPFSLSMVVLAPELVAVLLGPGWSVAVLPLQILLIGVPFRTSVKISDSLAKALGSVYRSAIRKVAFGLAVILGSWIGHYWGLPGVAAGVTFAVLLNFVLMTHLSFSLTEGSWRKFSQSSRPGIALSLIALLICVPATLASRVWMDAPVFVLLSTTVVTGIGLAGAIAFHPELIGPDGLWLARELIAFVPGRWRHSLIGKRANLVEQK